MNVPPRSIHALLEVLNIENGHPLAFVYNWFGLDGALLAALALIEQKIISKNGHHKSNKSLTFLLTKPAVLTLRWA